MTREETVLDEWGYCMTPIEYKSIVEAIRLAKEEGMAFRIYTNGKCVKSG